MVNTALDGQSRMVLDHLRPPCHRACQCRSELVREFNGEVAHGVPQPVDRPAEEEGAIGVRTNNYTRAEGQNVG